MARISSLSLYLFFSFFFSAQHVSQTLSLSPRSSRRRRRRRNFASTSRGRSTKRFGSFPFSLSSKITCSLVTTTKRSLEESDFRKRESFFGDQTFGPLTFSSSSPSSGLEL